MVITFQLKYCADLWEIGGMYFTHSERIYLYIYGQITVHIRCLPTGAQRCLFSYQHHLICLLRLWKLDQIWKLPCTRTVSTYLNIYLEWYWNKTNWCELSKFFLWLRIGYFLHFWTFLWQKYWLDNFVSVTVQPWMLLY